MHRRSIDKHQYRLQMTYCVVQSPAKMFPLMCVTRAHSLTSTRSLKFEMFKGRRFLDVTFVACVLDEIWMQRGMRRGEGSPVRVKRGKFPHEASGYVL
jgi:hypothetical protein